MISSKETLVDVAGVGITAGDILLETKLADGLSFVESIGVRRAFARKAESTGLAVSEAEIDEALSQFCLDRELERNEVPGWLESRRATEENLRAFLREKLLSEKYRQNLASDEVVGRRFAANPHNYARAKVEVITCRREGEAREKLLSLREGEIVWHGGEIREFWRADAPVEIAGALFSSQPGDFLGPVETEDESCELWRVVSSAPPSLDEETRNRIAEELVDEETRSLLVQNPAVFRA